MQDFVLLSAGAITSRAGQMVRQACLIFNLCWILVILMGVIYWGIYRLQLNQDLMRLRSEGLPVDIQELNEFSRLPEDAVDATPFWSELLIHVQDARLSKRGSHLPLLGEEDLDIPPVGEPWNELPAAQAFLIENLTLLQFIRSTAEAEGEVRFSATDSFKDPAGDTQYQTLRQMANLLALDASVAAREGDCDRTFHDLFSMLKIVSVLKNEPMFLPQLSRNMIAAKGVFYLQEVLPVCAWDDVRLQSLQEVISNLDYRTAFIRGFQGERAYWLSMIDSVPLGPLNVFAKVDLIRRYDRFLRVLEMPWPEPLTRSKVEKEMEAKEEEQRFQNPLTITSRLFSSSLLSQAAGPCVRAIARQRCAVIGLAVRRHELRHGVWPATMQSIDRDLLGGGFDPQEGFLDPADGQPLRFKTEPDRTLIYSIGEDQIDDGGNVSYRNQDRPPTDLGFIVFRQKSEK